MLNQFMSKLAIVFALLTMGMLPSYCTAQNSKWDTGFVLDDVCLVLALDVESLVKSVDKESEMYTTVQRTIKDEMGFDINDVQQFQFIMGAGDDDLNAENFNEEDVFEAKIIFKKDQKIDEVAADMFKRGKHEPDVHNGIKYFRSIRRSMPSLYTPNAKTIIVANEPRLKKLIDSPVSMGDFVDRLATADKDADFIFTFSKHELLEKTFLSEMPKEPINVREIGGEAERGDLAIDLDSDTPITGQIIAKNPEGAERLKRAIDALIGLGKFSLPQGKKQLEAEKNLPAEMKKLAFRGMALAELILNGTKITTADKTLDINVSAKGGISDAVESIGLMFFGVRNASDAAVEVIIDAERVVEGIEIEKVEIEKSKLKREIEILSPVEFETEINP